jgi:hypothetical protein
MEKHPDCQPRSSVTMNGGNYNDRNGNKQFKGKGIDGAHLGSSKVFVDAKRC